MNDAELLKLIKSDPEKGIGILMNEYTDLLYSVVKAKIHNTAYYSSDIEDCVSDAFVKFYFELGKFDPKLGSIRSYLCVIARNLAIDTVRKRNVEQERIKDILFDNPNGAFDGEEEFSVESEYLNSELVSEIMLEISTLDPTDREIVVRKFYLSQSSKEIAETIGMSVSNINVRIHRVLKKLREKFGGKRR